MSSMNESASMCDKHPPMGNMPVVVIVSTERSTAQAPLKVPAHFLSKQARSP